MIFKKLQLQNVAILDNHTVVVELLKTHVISIKWKGIGH